eukprot:28473-Chlamydomonas_euryale.AAC.1
MARSTSARIVAAHASSSERFSAASASDTSRSIWRRRTSSNAASCGWRTISHNIRQDTSTHGRTNSRDIGQDTMDLRTVERQRQ